MTILVKRTIECNVCKKRKPLAEANDWRRIHHSLLSMEMSANGYHACSPECMIRIMKGMTVNMRHNLGLPRETHKLPAYRKLY